MKKLILSCLVLISLLSSHAQLTVQSGATLHLAGNAQITLQNMSLANDGTLDIPANGRFIFTGSGNNEISGGSQPGFAELEIAKTGSGLLTLQQNITIKNKIIFTSNVIDLNTYNIELNGTAFLENETEASHIIGASGGQIILTTTLNAPSSINPGNLGITITSSKNLGITVIRRGHQSQINSGGGGNSILRYYDILPANNSALNASLHMQYFDSELNGLDEGELELLKSADHSNWQKLGFTSRDAGSNFLEKSGLETLYRFTLSTAANALPLVWGDFETRCETSGVTIQWQTIQESNTSFFIIQHSNDGVEWTEAGRIKAAGNTSAPLNYSFNDRQSAKLYRIIQTDMNGRSSISQVLQSACGRDEYFKAYPNPVHNMVTVVANALSNQAFVTIRVIDVNGLQVRRQTETLIKGLNQLKVNMNGLAAGSYWLHIQWSDGRQKTVRLEKQ